MRTMFAASGTETERQHCVEDSMGTYLLLSHLFLLLSSLDALFELAVVGRKGALVYMITFKPSL